jgi:hypothetical protein
MRLRPFLPAAQNEVYPDFLALASATDCGSGRDRDVWNPSQTESWRAENGRAIFAKMEIRATPLAVAGLNPAVNKLPTRREQTTPKLTSDRRAQPEIADLRGPKNFFTPNGYNPLKSLISKK